MSAPIPVAVCPIPHCRRAHPAAHISEHGCPSCSLAIAQLTAYAEHKALILASPAYAEQAARREHAYYHPVEPENRS